MATYSPLRSLAASADDRTITAVRDELRAIALLGEGPSIRRLRSQIQRIGPHFRTALLIGEPGTGREAAGRQLHALSPVARGPFVVCHAEELADEAQATPMDAARHGTLFIRGIETLPLPRQALLARRLQRLDSLMKAHTAETRVIAASPCDLRPLASSGQFRQDLYGRVSVIEIRLAPLRERLEDIGILCESLVGNYRSRQGGELRKMAPETVERLLGHSWPRNLEELREVVEQALVSASDGPGPEHSVAPVHLPELRAAEPTPAEPVTIPIIERLDDVLRRHVLDVLGRCAGNKVKAAELLGISRSTLYRMIDSAAV